MTSEASGITRTERRLTIAGTRITLSSVMDYVMGQYPSQFIQGLFELTEEQLNAALVYIDVDIDIRLERSQISCRLGFPRQPNYSSKALLPTR